MTKFYVAAQFQGKTALLVGPCDTREQASGYMEATMLYTTTANIKDAGWFTYSVCGMTQESEHFQPGIFNDRALIGYQSA